MRLLIIHPEARHFGGAEKMLCYFVDELVAQGITPVVALVRGSQMDVTLRPDIPRLWVRENSRFSVSDFLSQVRAVRAEHSTAPFDLMHGWAARDWDLTIVAGKLSRCPTLGTLHDHPTATYITSARRRLMRWCANWGLERVVCVSQAVLSACAESGYTTKKLAAVHNGLPSHTQPTGSRRADLCRLGFLGTISEIKGVRGLFEMLDQLESQLPGPWELAIGGSASDAAGQALEQDLKTRYATRAWWPKVRWLGWIQQPEEFLHELDCLIVPSTDFDSFPTVLLEAGRAGVPVLASRVGGVPEIVLDGQTGWLFEPRDWKTASTRLGALINDASLRDRAGETARERMRTKFTLCKMVLEYQRLYGSLSEHGK